jgi:tetratricopeptide (TPR) repeat protein
VSSLLVGRFMRLPQRSDERWQGGLVRLPMWVDEPGGSFRPWGAAWVSRRTGFVHMKAEERAGAHDWTLALAALIEFGLQTRLAGCRPAVLEVADAELGQRIREALGDSELTIVPVADLSAVNEVLTAMEEHETDGPPPPSALAGKGVTVERMRAFAGAAKRFWDAAPWQYLTDEDLVHVEAPITSPGLGHVTVLGGAGLTFGLGFFDSAEDYEEFQDDPLPSVTDRPRWSVLFGPMPDLPFGDVDLWEDHGLPVAGDDAYPMAVLFSEDGVRRPDARTLAYLEGLLAALAATTDDEIDGGRWERQCQTADGTVRYRLAIPALLEPVDAPGRHGASPDRRATERVTAEIQRSLAGSEFESLEDANRLLAERFRGPIDALPSTASTPLERAQDLAYRAFDAYGRRRIQLARKALELSRDCADAWVILAEEASDLERARGLYSEGVTAGERALGQELFEREAGQFWLLVETRPYMRARLGLAEALQALGRRDEAIAHYLELLRLNTNDNQGVRDLVLPALLLAGRDDEAAALLERYAGDPSAVWQYGRALVAYRRDGDSPAARDLLGQALRSNRRVAKYLGGVAPLPDEDPDRYAFGSEEEAVIAARLLGEAWRTTPGAVAWLAAADRKGSGGGKKRRR